MNANATKKLFWIVGLILLLGLLVPQHFQNPVEGANNSSYHPESFWYYPWGRSGTHKGVDIFAKEGTPVNASTAGLVIFSGTIGVGGNVVVVLGPKWRMHYYAHLRAIEASAFSVVHRGERLGSVGTTGNASGKAPHLHYSVSTLIPYVWKIDADRQGWKKMFYLNPIMFLKESSPATR